MRITPDTYTVLSCGCWEWNGDTNPGGYAFLGSIPAYKLAYAESKGKAPKGLSIDHLCHNKLCVNPDHLEAIPLWVNQYRRRIHTLLFGWSTHCNKGHLMDDMNTVWRANGTGRQCRLCQNIALQEYAVRVKGRKRPVDYSPTFDKPHGSISRKHEYTGITQELLDKCETTWEHVELMRNCAHGKTASEAISQGAQKTYTLPSSKS